MKDLQQIIKAAKQAIAAARTSAEIQQIRVKYLGRKAELALGLHKLADLEAAQRRQAGAELNRAKLEIEAELDRAEKKLRLLTAENSTPIDVTAPGEPIRLGHIHPVTQVLEEITAIFTKMGYDIASGPEVETDWYNFEALNIPVGHPARDMQATFYLENGLVPRTHTSGVQIRYMENHQPPIKIISPGKVYRNENEDARHSWEFYQVEGLVVDEGISLADLKGTLLAMMRGLLGEQTEIRLRPSFFPYTEPSVEMDGTCFVCRGKGCGVCGQSGWIELGGAGMVHPQVLRNGGIDPERYSGFAFGFGPERIAALKYQVPDVRYFWRPNFKFLEQF